jgi:hypothetical protein
MITSGMPDMGLGMEVAAPDIMDRPPQSKQGIFTWEVIVASGPQRSALRHSLSACGRSAMVIWPVAGTRSGPSRSETVNWSSEHEPLHSYV